MTCSKPSPAFADLLAQRLSRRRLLQTGAALAPLALSVPGLLRADAPQTATPAATLSFKPIQISTDDAVIVPSGYTYDVVARWGDALWSGVPDLDTARLIQGTLLESAAAERQSRQFGQNCDAIHYFPLQGRADHGVLCVNNEYTDDELMFAGHPGFNGFRDGTSEAFARKHPQVVGVAQAAHGVSVIEVRRERGQWRMVKDSRYNRRITANTPIDIGGPARGAEWMRTRDDPRGEQALGTIGNCAGGMTPWGTYLTAEENIQDYFANLQALSETASDALKQAHGCFRMYSRQSAYNWEVTDPRFDLTRTPHEPFRFGWIVEIDPLDPTATPVKRTALGRFAHEGASPHIAPDGRVAVYMGDDDRFEYVYKFISTARFSSTDQAANRRLLDQGTLHVARFDAEGRGQWLPLVFDPQGPLNAAAGFRNQAEVLIKARAAAHLLGATPMDRPEDVQVNPVTGRIYVACTNNATRSLESRLDIYNGRAIDMGPNAANPRGANAFGHIIEIHEAGDDHASLTFQWDVFLLAGDPQGELVTDLAKVGPDSVYFGGFGTAQELSPIGSPDNVGFDRAGNLWIVTDGRQPTGGNNGCWVSPTTGELRGRLQQFMSGPVGAEVCGCEFTPDDQTLFLSIQHPGEGGTLTAPGSHWPDGGTTQPRSSVIAVRKMDGGVIGS